MVRTYLFQENVYPILIRELLKYEEAIQSNDQKAIASILEYVIVDGSPLSEKKRTSMDFIKANREKILEDIRTMKNDPQALVHHPTSITYPAKFRIIAEALLSCEGPFRKKNFQDPEFRAIVKREVTEMANKQGFRIRHLESYFVDYYDRLLTLLDELKAEKKSQLEDKQEDSSDDENSADPKSSSKASDAVNEDKDEESVEKDAESSVDKEQMKIPTSVDVDKLHLQVKVKKLSSQEVREGVAINSSIGEEGPLIEEAIKAVTEELIASSVDAEDDDVQEMVEEGAGTPMDVDSLKSGDKKSSKSTRDKGKSNQILKKEDSSSEKLSEAVENNGNIDRLLELGYLDGDDLLEIRVKSLEINEWAVGQMAWTLIDGLFYWPCIVTKDANSNQHINTQCIGGKPMTRIHVKCFGETGVDKWVDKDSLMEGNDPDDAEKIGSLFNSAVEEFQELLKKDIHERIHEIGPKKRRACSQSVVASQEPVLKKMKLDEEKS